VGVRCVAEQEIQKGEVIIYTSKEGPKLEVRLEKDTVWLDAHLIAKLFGVNRPAIVKHINNIYKTSELDKKSTCSILEQVAADGKIRKMNLYNLDMIISVGYRVNSKRATAFRIWATKTLKEHLIKGYTVDEKRLLQAQDNLKNLQETISLLQEKSKHKSLVGQENEILDLLSNYAKTLTLLEHYDQEKIELVKKEKGKFIIKGEEANMVIQTLKKELTNKKEASDLFGIDTSNKLKGILGNIYQTFGGKELYPSLEEKAAHLLYFIIKDHPFTDGNKRIASFLFVYFLDKNGYLYKSNGEKKINDNALTSLTLLIAISSPNEKDKFIKLITNLLAI
jgi:death-on-curing family protein